MSRRFLGLVAAMVFVGAALLAGVFFNLGAARQRFLREAALAGEQASQFRKAAVLYTESRIAAGVTFGQILLRSGATPVLAASIVNSTQGIFDLRNIRAGNRIEIGHSVEGELRAIRYQIDADRVLSIRPDPDAAGRPGSPPQDFQVEVQAVPSQTAETVVRGEIRDSLFNAVKDAGESPELAMSLAQIFAWDLDFYNDTRRGDTFRLIVEKKSYLSNQAPAYGRILAAEYNNGGRLYRAVLFHDASGAPTYYGADGQSLQKAFLRSPLKFAAPVTSRFSNRRFHPILKSHRPHLGVDYGAPTGTPVQAIGAGRVIFSGARGGDGNMVEIQHANGYQTMYLHLSKILVRTGQHVNAGDRIGLVGMTGLATGPHLDFRIKDHGVFRNFETLRLHLPPAEPVSKDDLAEFAGVRDRVLEELNGPTLDARSSTAADSAASEVSLPSLSR